MTGIFGGGSDQPQAAPKPPAPMPDDQSAEVLAAKRAAQEKILSRAGRQSTILTKPENRGGEKFDSYGSKTLGATG